MAQTYHIYGIQQQDLLCKMHRHRVSIGFSGSPETFLRPAALVRALLDAWEACPVQSPPSGTVTFLFTDIEGSTRRWQDEPDAMRALLAEHDAILREVIEKHKGLLFKHIATSPKLRSTPTPATSTPPAGAARR